MIKVFNPSDTVFTSGGNKTLFPISCIEKKVTSEDWFIETELPMSYIGVIQQDSIVVVPTKYGSQPFRVSNIGAKRSIEFTAYHVGFDSKLYIIDSLSVTGTPTTILNALFGATTDTNHFTAYSDITTTKTLSFAQCTLYDAILAVQEAFGCFLDFNVWQIRLTSTLGANRGLEFRKGKNLKSTEIHEDWSEVCTTILGYGNSDITLTPKTRSSVIVYDRPYTKVKKYSTSDLVELESLVLADLDKYAVPKINYKVEASITDNLSSDFDFPNGYSYEDLETYTYEELEGFSYYDLESEVHGISIGKNELVYKLNDVVVVKSDLFSITGNILSYAYNILSQRTKSLEFGNYIRTVRRAFSAINESIEEVKNRTNELRTITAIQTELLNNAGTYGYCIKTENEIYFCDTIPLSTATLIMRLNVAGLGFSSTGVSGPYTQAWTLDGHLNADFISGLTITGVKIETTEDMKVGKILSLVKVVPQTNTELAQMRLGKYGIHFGEDVDGSGYPYAYMTAYDRSYLAGLGTPSFGMMIRTNAELQFDSAENIITAPKQSRTAIGHIYKNVNVEAIDWTEILSFTLDQWSGVRVNVTVGGVQGNVGSFGLVRSMNFKKDDNTPTGAYSTTTEWWGTSNQTSHLRYVITGDDVSIQVKSANTDSCFYKGKIEAIGYTV